MEICFKKFIINSPIFWSSVDCRKGSVVGVFFSVAIVTTALVVAASALGVIVGKIIFLRPVFIVHELNVSVAVVGVGFMVVMAFALVVCVFFMDVLISLKAIVDDVSIGGGSAWEKLMYA